MRARKTLEPSGSQNLFTKRSVSQVSQINETSSESESSDEGGSTKKKKKKRKKKAK
jgi:hypothetical protein